MGRKDTGKKTLADKFADSVSHGKVKDVTDANYRGKAAAVLARKDYKAVMICPIENPREWGAWLSYFKHIGHDVKWMKSIGQRRSYDLSATRYLVPTAFPHEFDHDRLEITDRTAADAFEKRQAEARAAMDNMGTPEERLKQARDAMAFARKLLQPPVDQRHKKTPRAHLMPERDPKRWRDPEELRASRDRMFERLGIDQPQEEEKAHD